MINFRFIMTFLTLIGIIYGIIKVKSFLNENFVEKDTVIKKQMNDFLNGKQKIKTTPIQKPADPTERIIEIDQEELDKIIQNSDKE